MPEKNHQPLNAAKLLPEEVVKLLGVDSPANRARREFSSACARIEQASAQREPLNPVAMRRMEFEAVEKIATALGVPLTREGLK